MRVNRLLIAAAIVAVFSAAVALASAPVIPAAQEQGQRSVVLRGDQAWTPTGITVHRGDRLSFSASGQIMWQAGKPANPNGGEMRAGDYPVPNKPVGMLIGRVGSNGTPFPIGAEADVTMPADGELFLGINDDLLRDNSGEYEVRIASGSVGTSGRQAQSRAVSIRSDQAWTQTGITVRRGERLSFSATGRIVWQEGKATDPNGGELRRPTYPVANRPVGMLIGRVGANGTPFPIGTQAEVTMPADGRLFLGINDDQLQDNSGEYRVEISRSSVGTSGREEQPATVSVQASQAWTSTGVTVYRGESLEFNASGQIQWAKEPSKKAGPDGAPMASDATQHYPVPSKGVGALVGRVGRNGQPFAIGSHARITMPADGELFLGVNDDYTTDNSGSYSVQITRATGGE